MPSSLLLMNSIASLTLAMVFSAWSALFHSSAAGYQAAPHRPSPERTGSQPHRESAQPVTQRYSDRQGLDHYGLQEATEYTMARKQGWESGEAVSRWLQTADGLVRGRRDILSIIARLSTAFVADRPTILDLGCGHGDVTAEILKIRPHASIWMVDFSDEMIRLARERFSDNENIKVIKHDLNGGIPDELLSIEFDQVVSCFAIHHVEYENRVGLYADIRRVLSEDGLFVNGDRFIGESPVVSKWEFDNWIAWMTKQIKNELGIDEIFDHAKRTQMERDEKMGDKPGTLWDMQEDLRQADFQYVDCMWKSHNLGVIVATKGQRTF